MIPLLNKQYQSFTPLLTPRGVMDKLNAPQLQYKKFQIGQLAARQVHQQEQQDKLAWLQETERLNAEHQTRQNEFTAGQTQASQTFQAGQNKLYNEPAGYQKPYVPFTDQQKADLTWQERLSHQYDQSKGGGGSGGAGGAGGLSGLNEWQLKLITQLDPVVSHLKSEQNKYEPASLQYQNLEQAIQRHIGKLYLGIADPTAGQNPTEDDILEGLGAQPIQGTSPQSGGHFGTGGGYGEQPRPMLGGTAGVSDFYNPEYGSFGLVSRNRVPAPRDVPIPNIPDWMIAPKRRSNLIG